LSYDGYLASRSCSDAFNAWLISVCAAFESHTIPTEEFVRSRLHVSQTVLKEVLAQIVSEYSR
jgi:hypothetical protein